MVARLSSSTRLGSRRTGYQSAVAGKPRSSGRTRSAKGAAGETRRPPALVIGVGALAVYLLFRAIVSDTVAIPERLSGDVTGVHDPTMVRDGDTWYIFSTGWGIPIRSSPDLEHWEVTGSVFPDGLPGWVQQQVPDLRDDEISGWAPDVSKIEDTWHLYWSIGIFGTSKAVIGHATNVTLDPSNPDYTWVDQGPVVASGGSGSPTMAIDPTVATDAEGDRYMAWGSFGQGIMLQQLDPETGKLLAGSRAVNLARRDPFFLGIEGAHLVEKDGWWWLFVSFGFCCRGVNSSYSIHVGRSRAITGPYLDLAGVPMTANGGTTVTGSYSNVVGPGHGSVVENGDSLMLVHHFYDRNNGGKSTLLLRPLTWGPDGWPISPDAGFSSGDITGTDVVGQWHMVGYPEEKPARGPEDVTVTLQADGSVAPSGTWEIDGEVVHISDVGTPAGPRGYWLAIDPETHIAFGRDSRTAAVRALRLNSP